MEIKERWTHFIHHIMYVVDIVYLAESEEYLVRHMVGQGPEVVSYHGKSREDAYTAFRYLARNFNYSSG